MHSLPLHDMGDLSVPKHLSVSVYDVDAVGSDDLIGQSHPIDVHSLTRDWSRKWYTLLNEDMKVTFNSIDSKNLSRLIPVTDGQTRSVG